jgi:hypothetical protein
MLHGDIKTVFERRKQSIRRNLMKLNEFKSAHKQLIREVVVKVRSKGV